MIHDPSYTRRFLLDTFLISRMVHGASQKSLQGLGYEDKEKKCPDCGSKEIVLEGSEIICKKCGYVLE